MQAMTKSRGDRKRERISGLPEDVLHILSFLTTRQAIQMSLLSKRWRYLWTSIPSLHFSQGEFGWVNGIINRKFLDFVDQVLTLRSKDVNIKKFYFASMCRCESRVREWILHAIRGGNVEELVLWVGNLGVHQKPELPRCLFICQSLMVLKLEMANWGLKLPNDFSLSRLKILHLRYIISERGDSVDKLVARCPSLEDLHLGECYVDTLTISGNKLKKLHISNCGGKGESKVQVSVPSLLSFEYKTKGRQHCSLYNLVSLVEADISMRVYDMVTIFGILRGIRNASYIKLNYGYNEHVCLEEELVGCVPTFHNLTSLILEIPWNKDHVQPIIYIRKHSPDLKTVIVRNQGRTQLFFTQEDLDGYISSVLAS